MDLFSLLGFFGGLGLFLFGMHVMGDAIKRQAGGKLKGVLEKMTASPLGAALLGAGVTALIQSSGATSVMVIGFINSGIMTLEHSVGITFGANIGTTVTAWILSLNSISGGESLILKLIDPDTFVPILTLIGAIMVLFSKRDIRKDVGYILLGFSILMYGMGTMSDTMSPLRSSDLFRTVMLALSNPILGVIAGFIMTAVLQSSSAAVGIIQAAAVTGIISFGNAFPIILGQNIGAGLIVLLASVGTNRDARRSAWVYIVFNVLTMLIFIIPLCILKWGFDPDWMMMPLSAFDIAIVHTGSKIISTAILLPFSNGIVKITGLIVKADSKEAQYELLDENLLKTPGVAVRRCHEITQNMGQLAQITVKKAMGIVLDYDESTAKNVDDLEDELDIMEDKIGAYLIKLSGLALSASDNRLVAEMLHSIGDFERISDHAKNLTEAGSEMSRKAIYFSDEAKDELKRMFDAVNEVVSLAVEAYCSDSAGAARKVEPLEQVIDDMKDRYRSSHIRRLQSGICSTTQGFVFSDILTDLERVSDHCSNIAVNVLQYSDNITEAHSYTNEVHFSDESFKIMYGDYKAKYLD